jgi:hypothetical protein
MASDLLTKIRGEIQRRLDELRPLILEHERLLAVERSLDDMAQDMPAGAAKRPRGGAGSTAGTVKRTAGRPRPKQKRPMADHAGQAILDALEHGSHTVSELVTVTAASAGKIRGSIRRLLAAERIQKVDRDGKTAYARLAGSAED